MAEAWLSKTGGNRDRLICPICFRRYPPVWTTYTYDGSGRTLTVTAPDGASTTTSYAGNDTTVTDAAGKWKTSTRDAFGNLTLVTEPNPAGGTNWTTSYTYSALNQLTHVTMPRPEGIQTRTFAYTGADMTSATNPENGTVTYTYDNAHHVLTRTDALGLPVRQHGAAEWNVGIRPAAGGCRVRGGGAVDESVVRRLESDTAPCQAATLSKMSTSR